MNHNSDSWMEKMMKKIVMKKMLEKMYSNENMDFYSNSQYKEMFDFDDNTMKTFQSNLFKEKMKENMMMYKMEQMFNEDSSYNPFNKNSYRERMAALLQRHKRQAPKKPENAAVTLPENLDLGDRLADKLKQEQIEMEQKIGNMTCVMREIGVLNQQNELDFAAQKRAFEKFNIPNQWLKNRLLNDMELCNKVADSL